MSQVWQRYAIWIFLAGVVLLIYLPAVSFDFVNLDDNRYLYENPHITGLSVEHAVWAFTTGDVSNWHPLTWLSHMLDYALFGMQAGGHHFTSVLFHLANAILLFEWLRRMTGATWRSALVAALFAVHPLHVESVAWVSERKDVLSTFFGFLSLLAYSAYVRRQSAGRYGLALVFLILGLMAKPMLVTLPLVMLLLDYWPLRRDEQCSWPSLVVEKAPFFLVAAASSAVTLYVQHEGGSVMALEKFPIESRLFNAIVSYVEYLWKTAWPSGLAVFYPHPGTSLPLIKVAFAFVALAAFLVAAIALTRQRRYVGVGWFWYLGTLVPAIGLVQVGLQSMADRYTYIPLIGIFMLVAWGAFDATERRPFARRVLTAACGIGVFLFSVVSIVQVHYWRNTETLFEHAIVVTENNALAHYNLGTMLLRDQRLREAMTHFRETIRIEPTHANAHNNLGTALYLKGEYDEAALEFAEAVQIDSSLANARYNLATTLSALGKDEEAAPEFEESLRLDAENPDIRFNFGNSLMHLKRNDEAAEQYREALRLNPDYVDAHMNLGAVLLDSGKTGDAIREYREAGRLAPHRADTFTNLGYACARAGQLKEAEEAFSTALELDPNNETMKRDRQAIQEQLKDAGPHVVPLKPRN